MSSYFAVLTMVVLAAFLIFLGVVFVRSWRTPVLISQMWKYLESLGFKKKSITALSRTERHDLPYAMFIDESGYFGLYHFMEGEFRNRELTAGGTGDVFFFTAKLSGTVDGQFYMKSAFSNTPIKGEPTDLESIEFNDRVVVRARPKHLATKFMSPDTMEWFMRLEKRPTVYVHGQLMTCVFVAIQKVEQIEDFLQVVHELAIRFERSGALEK